MYCRKCGNALKENAVFCSKCGEKINRNVDNPNLTETEKTVSSTHRKKRIIIGLFIVIFLALLLPIVLRLRAYELDVEEAQQYIEEQVILSGTEGNLQEAETMEEPVAVMDEVSELEAEATSELIENLEEVEQEENVPTWYMDSEGIKSNSLGLMIRKDNTVFDELGFFVNYGIYTPYASGTGGRRDQLVFSCHYFEGDLDDYISEHINMEKGKLGDIAYAYGGNFVPDIEEVAFVGNGIVIYAYIYQSDIGENESLNDYLNRIDLIKVLNEPSINCLAYIVDDGLYCPALGIKLSTQESEHNIAGIGVSCYGTNSRMSIRDESAKGMGTMYYIADASDAQEVVDLYVEGAIEPDEYKTVEYSAIEGTVELDLGEYRFLGRGVEGGYDWSDTIEEEWLFYSDDLTWSITVEFEQGNQYEDHVCVIEDIG